MERKAIFSGLLVAAMIQACYCGTPAWKVITSYSDSACTVPAGGEAVVLDYTCNPYPCSAVAGLYTEATCSPSDPIASGVPAGAAVRYKYPTTGGICLSNYAVAAYALPGVCFIDDKSYVFSFSECSSGQMTFQFWVDYTTCVAGTDTMSAAVVTEGQCRANDGDDDKGVCPIAPPVNPPVDAPANPPVDPPTDAPVAAPMDAPMTEPMSTPISAPVAAPVSAPVKTPVTKASGAVTNTVVAVTLIGAIVLLR